MTDEQSAVAVESSPAAMQDVVNSMTPEQRLEWRKTGNLPAPPAKTADSAPATETKEPPAADKTAESAPDSGSGESQQEPTKRKGIKERSADLDREIADLQAKLGERARLRKQLAQDAQADSSPAAAKAEEPKAPVKPKLDDFETLDAYEAARDTYEADLKKYAVETFRKEQEAAQKKAETEKVEREIGEKWAERAKQAQKAHPDEQVLEAVNSPELWKDIDASPSAKAITGALIDPEFDMGVEVAFHLSQNEADRKRILAIRNPYHAVYELKKLGDKLSEAAAKAPAPQKAVTKAPPPPSEVGGRGTSAGDDALAALAEGDFERYRRSQNEKDKRRMGY